MKSAFFVCYIAISSATVQAEEFMIGYTAINIPPPDSYVLVTEHMKAMHDIFRMGLDPANENIASYIHTDNVVKALNGEIISEGRSFWVKLPVSTKVKTCDSREFEKFKEEVKSINKKTFDSIRGKLDQSKNKYEFAKALLKNSRQVMLPHHMEAPNSIAFSFYNKLAIQDETSNFEIISGTATLVWVSGKVITLFCYGGENDMMWTRDASQAWLEAILAKNPNAPATESASGVISQQETADRHRSTIYISPSWREVATGVLTIGITILILFAIGKVFFGRVRR